MQVLISTLDGKSEVAVPWRYTLLSHPRKPYPSFALVMAHAHALDATDPRHLSFPHADALAMIPAADGPVLSAGNMAKATPSKVIRKAPKIPKLRIRATEADKLLRPCLVKTRSKTTPTTVSFVPFPTSDENMPPSHPEISRPMKLGTIQVRTDSLTLAKRKQGGRPSSVWLFRLHHFRHHNIV